MPVLLIVLGIFFAIKFKFFYILHPIKTFKTILKNQRGGFKSLSLALAGTLGVGNIVGVSSAIVMGGAGSIFWMWVSAFCAMSLKYTEVYLAMAFRKNKNGVFYGGAPYYINEGLSKKIGFKSAYILSCIFAIFCAVNSLTTGNLVQINSVSSLLPVSPLIFGIIFTVLTFAVICGGLKRISSITSVLIPVLSLTYIILCLCIVFSSIDKIPNIFLIIVKDAFTPKAALGGFCGYGFTVALRYGVCRGVLSNEAGCGTSPCAHASSECDNPHAQACLGVFEVFIDTVVLCTLTAFVIMLSDIKFASSPISLVLDAFERFFGKLGSGAVLILCILFAFATVICQFFYGVESIGYITKKRSVKRVFLFIFCLILLIGAVIPMSLMWQISDLSIATMTIINLICLFLLRKNTTQ